MTRRLDPLLDPQSICFIGASSSAGRIGGLPLSLIVKYGYSGGVYPVNPKYDEVFGLKCYPDVESVPAVPDLAVLAIAAGEVTAMLARCHAKGIRAAIVYAAGFAEEGETGQKLQQELESFAQSSGMVVAGPNCMGLANLNTQAHTAFASVFNTASMQEGRGRVSLLTQSGNVCAALYALLRRLDQPVSQFINTGNEATVDFAEYLEYLAEDPDTEVVLGYVEQLRDGPRFLKACERLEQQGKMLIALKAGATDKGAAAVMSHTSALAGDREVYRSVFERLNVIEATDFAQMAELARLASLRHRQGGVRVAVLTMSGALGAILADRFIEAGLQLPDLPASVQGVLRSGIPDYGMVRNPVDVTGNVVNNPEFVDQVLEALATTAAVDAVVIYAPGYMLDRMADSIAAAASRHNRLFAVIDTGRAQCRDALREAQVAVFDDIGVATAALAPFLQWLSRCRSPGSLGRVEPLASGSEVEGLPPRADERQILDWLVQFGLPPRNDRVASSRDEALRHAQTLGYPVALKILSPDILHKTEVGGVALGLQDEQAVARAYDLILERVGAAAPQAQLRGVLVQRMESGGVEIIVGARRDPVFGPMLSVGLGGILTELYRDIRHELLPMDAEGVEAMLRRLLAFPLLDGFRGRPPADVPAACRAIAAIGRALAEAPAHVQEIEVNPLLVRERGSGVVALDALIVA
ncbi:MAG: acetate--CoA ligase family protein [Burkholderiaceae bacterium]